MLIQPVPLPKDNWDLGNGWPRGVETHRDLTMKETWMFDTEEKFVDISGKPIPFQENEIKIGAS